MDTWPQSLPSRSSLSGRRGQRDNGVNSVQCDVCSDWMEGTTEGSDEASGVGNGLPEGGLSKSGPADESELTRGMDAVRRAALSTGGRGRAQSARGRRDPPVILSGGGKRS